MIGMTFDLFQLNWSEIFWPKHPVEMLLRGTVMYLSLFLLMRFVLKREAGSIGTADLLMVVVIADAAQNALAGNYQSITDGVILVATILFWNYTLDWLSYHSPTLRNIIQSKPLVLVQDGKMNRRNMRKELVTKDDLLVELREHGIEDVTEVKEARIEEDGHISVIKKKKDEDIERPKK